jgi:selenide,water dikinase
VCLYFLKGILTMTVPDMAKRRRIMQRSIKLGHCVCDPKRPCPCDVFRNDGICPCAGERPAPKSGQVRLTELVHNPGCASKIPAADLERTLGRLPPVTDPAVLSGFDSGDDAGVYALNPTTTLVQTVDVFTPCVDDPETFGRICAANCLSDIYAMGAVPRTALSVLCFPIETLDGQVMYEMMKGAMAVFTEAGVALIGGHSVKDEEIKLGFAITGTLDRAAAVERNAARTGDLLVLTKKLGTGVLGFARQIGRVHAEGLREAEISMATLNREAAVAMREQPVSACTDITGFGLYGHLVGMARGSEVTIQVWADRLPAFPGAVEALADGVIPGACERNREHVGDDIRIAPDVPAGMAELGFDAQTSGGLLIAVPAAHHAALLAALARRGVPAWTIGRVGDASPGQIAVTLATADLAAAGTFAEMTEKPTSPSQEIPAMNAVKTPCCSAESASAAGSTAGASQKAFGALMRSAAEAGALDEKTKELLLLALAAATRCEPCLKAHLVEAAEMGISQAEIDEALWCAVAMGGGPVRMLCNEARKAVEGGKSGGKCC